MSTSTDVHSLAKSKLSLFWEEVATAYNMIAADHQLSGAVRREGKEAIISYETMTDQIVVRIRSASEEPPTLITP